MCVKLIGFNLILKCDAWQAHPGGAWETMQLCKSRTSDAVILWGGDNTIYGLDDDFQTEGVHAMSLCVHHLNMLHYRLDICQQHASRW